MRTRMRKFIPVIIFVIFEIYCLASLVPGQRIVGYYRIKPNEKDKKTKVVNLTDEAKSQCDSLIKSTVGESSIEVRFQKRFTKEAESILLAIEKSVARTREILDDPLENVRFYLLQKSAVPESYKILDDVGDKDAFLFLFVFSEKKDIETTCQDANDLCRSIYGTIPHELTHGVTNTLLRYNKTRWFDEGLSEFVGEEISRNFIANKKTSYVPAVSLHRKEIHEALWSWDYKDNSQNTRIPFFLYNASGHLLRLIFEDSARNGIVKPLHVLLDKLSTLKKISGNKASLIELENILQQDLKVNYKGLGNLDIKDQNAFTEEALKELVKTDGPESDKFKPLYILASIDEVPIPDKYIKILLDNVFTEHKDAFLTQLAATGVVKRFKQKNLDKVLQEYLIENGRLKIKSLKSLKEKLVKMSIRPLPKS